ncbi:PASTA domain-containing protein [Streptomyces specialis]|nr:PASTA domain-containing protein [Streptomyces specialis]
MHPPYLPPPPPLPLPPRPKWQHPAVVITLLIVFPPAGIVIVWLCDWPQRKKIIATVVSGLWFALLVFTPSDDAKDEKDDDRADSTPTEAAEPVTRTAVPDFAGENLATAGDTAREAGFDSMSHDATDEDAAQRVEGNWSVCFQSPAAGTEAALGTTIDFAVVPEGTPCPSRDGAAVTHPEAPDVTGLPYADAEGALRDIGLTDIEADSAYTDVTLPAGHDDWVVCFQSPAAGEELRDPGTIPAPSPLHIRRRPEVTGLDSPFAVVSARPPTPPLPSSSAASDVYKGRAPPRNPNRNRRWTRKTTVASSTTKTATRPEQQAQPPSTRATPATAPPWTATTTAQPATPDPHSTTWYRVLSRQSVSERDRLFVNRNPVLRPLVVADAGVVRSVLQDELDLFPEHFALGGRLGLPEDALPDREVTESLAVEVALKQLLRRASEVGQPAVGEIGADVDLPVGVGDHVDDLHDRTIAAPTDNDAGCPPSERGEPSWRG